jgi:hypothetical protein
MNTQQKKKLEEIQHKQDTASFESALNRARSVTVGTCFGGTTELMMRANDGSVLWCPMQPVEVVELIHQLAANVGCHVAVKPRSDFSSWRNWRVTPEEQQHLQGHPPFVNDMAPFMQVGINGIDKDLDVLLQTGAKIVEHGGGKGGIPDPINSVNQGDQNEQTVATQKTVGRKRTKRTATSA